MQKDGQSLLNSDVPMGLGMALAQNVEAMQAFSAMEPAKQRAIIDRTHTIGSKKERRRLPWRTFMIQSSRRSP